MMTIKEMSKWGLQPGSTYGIGDKFWICKLRYMLCPAGLEQQAQLVQIDTGMLWSTPVAVGDMKDIKPEEMLALIGEEHIGTVQRYCYMENLPPADGKPPHVPEPPPAPANETGKFYGGWDVLRRNSE